MGDSERRRLSDPPVSMFERWGPLALALVALVTAAVLTSYGWGLRSFVGDLRSIINMLGSVLVVALVLERALAVINNLLFGIEKTDAETQVERADTVLSSARAVVNVTGASDAAVANLGEATASLEGALQHRANVDTKRERLRLGVGFVLSVLIASVGVRVFGSLVTPPDPNTDQRSLFDFLDVLLTAGLLAGGSNGIAQIIDAIRRSQPNTGTTAPHTQLISDRLSWSEPKPPMTIQTPSVIVNQLKNSEVEG